MGGNNELENLVKLTYREHFICHWLLHLIHPESKGLRFAFYLLSFKTIKNETDYKKTIVPSSRLLEAKKIELIKSFSTTEHKEKVKRGKNKKRKNKKVSIDDLLKSSLDEYLKHKNLLTL